MVTARAPGHGPRVDLTLAEALPVAGCATGHFGKWHLGDFSRDRPVFLCLAAPRTQGRAPAALPLGPVPRPVRGRGLRGGKGMPFGDGQREPLLFFDEQLIAGARAGQWQYYRHVDRCHWTVPLDRPDTFGGGRGPLRPRRPGQRACRAPARRRPHAVRPRHGCGGVLQRRGPARGGHGASRGPGRALEAGLAHESAGVEVT